MCPDAIAESALIRAHMLGFLAASSVVHYASFFTLDVHVCTHTYYRLPYIHTHGQAWVCLSIEHNYLAYQPKYSSFIPRCPPPPPSKLESDLVRAS